MYTQVNVMEDINFANSSCEVETANVKIKTPKRVLHFSDGILEEFSDEEDNTTPPNEQNRVFPNPKTLSWGSWINYKVWEAGSSALAVCDYLGEHLAYFLGITSPKYWYEIEEYKRLEAANLEQMKKSEGWSEPASAGVIKLDSITTNQPASSNAVA